ncbi:cytochrome c-type biogenesis protein CcmH [Nitrosomonas sp. PY1]|uniref:c-type cytochrome biogenesis protein CcmI n=1 Tax=Nitrosomonas sp. PY1 TaxID=1803906 RepID=UPI001FC7D66D|nr:c-type cytochrome biogenesis protein CcmI [Nitrosomonas sp. PY1]GKS69184.1 cytochrome c-type biogenesis protein CcmH [Nitrosomonas sp. PY1]
MTTSFWVISGVFIVVALLFVVPTLLRNRDGKQSNFEHDTLNISVYRDQLAELDRDLQNDILTQEQYDKSKQELQQRMLQDVPDDKTVFIKKSSKLQNIATVVIIVTALPLAAVSIYLAVGDTRGLLPQDQLAKVTQPHSGNENALGHDNFASVLENLIARLEKNPGDIEGWVMLGRTYAIMGQYNEASKTYEKLNDIIPNNPQILSDYADVLAMTNQGNLQGKPTELVYAALAIDPAYPKALALAGTAEFEQSKYTQAVVHWEKLLDAIPADSQLAKSVKDSIQQARSLATGNDLESPIKHLAQADAAQQVKTDTPPMIAQQSQPQEQKPDQISTGISGQVTLSGELVGKATPNDTLFIYARAKTGPKMPLAILRLKVSDLPATFTLTDEMAMMPAMKISSFPEVVIEARISKSGQAVTSSGDLQGFSDPVKIGTSGIAIVINKQVP